MKTFEQWVKESAPSELADTPGTEAHRAKYGKMAVLSSRYGSKGEQDMAVRICELENAIANLDGHLRKRIGCGISGFCPPGHHLEVLSDALEIVKSRSPASK